MIKIEEQPLVTVAMVTYNSGKYVDMAIQSVLSSSYTNFELIISDDASTDNTWNIIQSYKDERIRAYRNETNITEYPNRNKCIDLAKGKYFIFIDGDDILYPHGLENYVFYFEQAPECGMVIQKRYFNNIVFPIVLSPKEVFSISFSKFGILSSSFSSNFFNTEKLKKEGGVSEKFIQGDSEIRYRMAMSYATLFISGWNTWPRETPGQASQKLNSAIGIIDNYKILNIVIESEKFPLSISVGNEQKIKELKSISSYFLKTYLKLKFSEVSLIKKELNLSIYKAIFLYLKRAKKTKSDIFNYDSSDPMIQNSFYERKN